MSLKLGNVVNKITGVTQYVDPVNYVAHKATEPKKEGEQVATNAEPTLDDLLLQQQLGDADFNKMMRPYIAGEAGLKVSTDGSLVPMTPQEMYGMSETDTTGISDYSPYRDEQARTGYWLNQKAQEQQLKYARGEGETPESIKTSLKNLRQGQESAVSQRLGPKGGLLSTPGINTMSDVSANELGVKQAYGFGNEQQGLGLLNNSYQNLFNNQNAANQNYGNIFTGGAGLPGLMQMANQSPMAQQGLSNLNALQTSQYQTGQQSAALGALGTLGSTYLTAGMGGIR